MQKKQDCIIMEKENKHFNIAKILAKNVKKM